jgi:hypothetical protein
MLVVLDQRRTMAHSGIITPRLVHLLVVIKVPFALFSSYSTPYEFKIINSLAQATRIFASHSLLPLALTSGLPKDWIYILEGT